MRRHLLAVTLALSACLAGCAGMAPAPPGTEADTQEATSTSSTSSEAFSYEHDPRDNPSAMADIEVDETAIYGFKPNAQGSLKEYADADWSDPVKVAEWREQRITYHESMSTMEGVLKQMIVEGASTEEIARTISPMRNELRIAAYADNEEGLEKLYARNLETYGHKEGPLPDELYEEFGSWETVIDKAFSLNSGMDACLGLYDDYYELYVVAGQVEG